jgi:hypothetical protein
MTNGSVQAYVALAGSDTGAPCKEVPEHGDCSGCCGDDEVDDDDVGVVVPGGLLLFDRCMSR